MAEEIVCWRCGESLVDLILPMSRREECKACGTDQHVCKLCKFYGVDVSNQCTEDRAEDVTNKESANFCDYFEPKPNTYINKETKEMVNAKAELAALFGDDVSEDNDQDQNAVSKEDAARTALEKLFGGDK